MDAKIPPEKRPDPLRRSCAICGKPVADALAPFCSKRCADVDLHRWLGGTYAIPADEPDPMTIDPFGDDT